MWKKVLLNVLCNIGIFLCLLGVYYGFTGKNYMLIAAGLFGAAVLIAIKVRLIKEVRNLERKP